MDNYTKSDEATFRDLIRVVFRHKAIIIIFFIVVMITVFIGLQLKTPVYEAQVKMLISAEKQVESPYYRDLPGYGGSEIALTQSEIVKSNPVIERAVEALELHKRPLDYEKNFCSPLKKHLLDFRLKKLETTLEDMTAEQKDAFLFQMAVRNLKNNIVVRPIRSTKLFTINARDFSPEETVAIANVVGRSYCIFDLQQQLAELTLKYSWKHPMVMQLRNNIYRMNRKLSGKPISALDAIGPASVKIIEQADTPLSPIGHSKKIILILALFMSLFLGGVLAFLFEYIDQTFRSPHDIVLYLDLPILGSIPKRRFRDKPIIRDKKSSTLYTQFYEDLSNQMYISMKDQNLKSVLITSSLPQEGTTTIVCNLGIYLAQEGGHKTIIVDANFRKPSIGAKLNLEEASGLADVLEGETSLGTIISNLGSNLSVIQAGKTSHNPASILSSPRMGAIIKLLKERYEVVIIDCASLKNYKDSNILSSYVEGVALVIDEGRTRRQVVKKSVTPLVQKKTNIIGVILNNRRFVIPKVIYDRL